MKSYNKNYKIYHFVFIMPQFLGNLTFLFKRRCRRLSARLKGFFLRKSIIENKQKQKSRQL
jgi:hypothetical protein